MAVNFPDFTNARLEDSPFKDLLGNVLKGYQIASEPEKMRDEQSARQMANQLRKMEVEHKPKEYELSDKAKEYANALQDLALKHKPKEYSLADALKQSQIDKNNRPGGANGALKLTGDIANYKVTHPDATDDQVREFADRLLESKINHTNAGTERSNVLNKSQNTRNLSALSKKFNELRDIQSGKFPGTDDKLSPQEQTNMQSTLMLSMIKDSTDPKTREKLINANNMNITLDSVNPDKAFTYSGIEGGVDKIGDRLLEGLGEGDPRYQDYLNEVTKLNFAAKQMRQYLGDSIQPTAQAKLDKLSNPEGWNVSPESAKRSFDFMKDLYRRESQTLVRAVSDPSLYSSTGSSNPATNNTFTAPAPDIPSSITNKAQFQQWLSTLTPAQRDALKAQHVGGR